MHDSVPFTSVLLFVNAGQKASSASTGIAGIALAYVILVSNQRYKTTPCNRGTFWITSVIIIMG